MPAGTPGSKGTGTRHRRRPPPARPRATPARTAVQIGPVLTTGAMARPSPRPACAGRPLGASAGRRSAPHAWHCWDPSTVGAEQLGHVLTIARHPSRLRLPAGACPRLSPSYSKPGTHRQSTPADRAPGSGHAAAATYSAGGAHVPTRAIEPDPGPGGEDESPAGTHPTRPAIGPVPIQDEALCRDAAFDLGKDSRPGLPGRRETPKDLVGWDEPERVPNRSVDDDTEAVGRKGSVHEPGPAEVELDSFEVSVVVRIHVVRAS